MGKMTFHFTQKKSFLVCGASIPYLLLPERTSSIIVESFGYEFFLLDHAWACDHIQANDIEALSLHPVHCIRLLETPSLIADRIVYFLLIQVTYFRRILIYNVILLYFF